MIAALRDPRRLGELGPALILAVTALFVLPHTAGGYRLVKWGVLGSSLAMAAVWLACTQPRRLPTRFTALTLFVTALTVLPALSPAVAPAHWPNAPGMLTGLVLFVVTAVAIDGRDDVLRNNLVVLVFSGVVCAGLVLLQAAGVDWFTSEVYTGIEFRSPGTFGNPNWAAAFIAPLSPLALGLGVNATRRRVYQAVAGLLALATLATVSRGGALTLAASLLAFQMLGPVPRRQRLWWLAVAVVGAVAAFVSAWQFGWVNAPWLRGRLFLWRAALMLVGEHPLTGVGLGAYPAAYGRAAAVVIDGDAEVFFPLDPIDFAHNDVLQFAAEAGVVTAVAFLLVIAMAVLRAHRLGTPLARALGASVVALFVNGFADSTLRMPATFALFFFLLGALWSQPLATPVASKITPWAKVGYHALFTVIGLLGAVQSVRLFAGNAYWTSGRTVLREGQAALAPLSSAQFFMPEHGRSASEYARALAKAGRIKEAIEASQHASLLRFDFDDEMFRRDLQSRSLSRAEAITLWQEFAERYPGLVTPYLRLGALHLQNNDRAAAINAYETVVANTQATRRAEAARVQARALLRSLLSRTSRE